MPISQRQHDHGRVGDLLARLEGRGVGFLLHALDELLHADAEADIELAGLIEHRFAVVGGVELLLANAKHAGLAGAKREQLVGGVLKRLGAIVHRQQVEVGAEPALRRLELLFDVVELVARIRRQRSAHVRGGKVAAGDDIAELADGLGGFGGVVGGKIGRSENGVDLGLGVQHRRACRGDESALCRTKRVILLVVEGGDIQPLAGGRGEALGRLVDVLDGLVERADHRLVGTELDDLAELLLGLLLQFLQLLGALVQRVLVLGGEQRRSLRGEACAERRQLQARRKARNVPSTEVDHAHAELLQHVARAGRDHDGHAGDHGESGEQAASHSPARPQKPKDLAKTEPDLHASAPQPPQEEMPVAVSR